jgi:hypothetical protein
MKLNAMFVITGILGLFFGVLILAIPGPFYAFYGGELANTGKNAAQLQGAAYLGYALLLLMATKVKELKARKAIVLGMLIHGILGFIVSLRWQLVGEGNEWGWTTVAIFAFFALGYAYFAMKKETE